MSEVLGKGLEAGMFISVLTVVLALSAQEAPAEAAVEDPQAAPVLRLDAAPQQPRREEDIVLRSAGQYATYHRNLGELRDRPVESAADLDRAMDTLSAYFGEDRLARAWIAYASLIAEQYPQFLDDVREVADYYGRDAAIASLANNPGYAVAFPHAREASDAVLDAIEEDSEEIRDVGEQYRIAAYNLQHARWANAVARDRQARLEAIITAGQNPLPPGQELYTSSFIDPEDIIGPASHRYTSPFPAAPETPSPSLALEVGAPFEPDRVRIGRILSIAALRAIADDDNAYGQESLDRLLLDPLAQRCLTWARINLEQCVAAGHFKYEDSFCIAQHALIDVSRCLEAAERRRE